VKLPCQGSQNSSPYICLFICNKFAGGCAHCGICARPWDADGGLAALSGGAVRELTGGTIEVRNQRLPGCLNMHKSCSMVHTIWPCCLRGVSGGTDTYSSQWICAPVHIVDTAAQPA
jgi:hypothetical protein